ncbi:MAG: FAD/NAD(P)-binding oxidoreductase [Candidatus Aminicenantes bacterium]|nr:FAD/NAD(P)-binding oxidoreductase [Candidatus Aminicenantes bacterium]
MSQTAVDVLIIGNGLAGIVAANRLAAAGAEVMLLDENIHIGGQILRQIPQRLGSLKGYHPDYVKKVGFGFIDAMKNNKIKVRNRARVLGIYPGREVLIESDEKKVSTVRAERILLATGARERFLPFPGWTMPGVLSGGAVQVLIKSSGVLPARDLVVGGSGLFLYSVAYECLKAGAKLRAVLEQTPMWNKFPLAWQVLHQLPKLTEGSRFLSRLFFSGVPLRFSTRIIEARGDGSLAQVVSAPVDGKGRVCSGREKIYPTPLLATGYGFSANIELAQMAGCLSEFAAERGGWVVKTDERLETSLPGVFAAGEITGIAGALKSICEGEIAALAILRQMGRPFGPAQERRLARLLGQRRHHLQFGKYFNLLYNIPASAYLDISDDTLVCRCEEVTMGDIRRAVANGYDTPATLKIALRSAMGDCQGRICGPIIYDILAALTGRSQAEMTPLVVRPPVKPVSIGSLASFQE